jgi:hypothetical protein
MAHGHFTVTPRIRRGRESETVLRCYAPRLYTIAALLVTAGLVMRPAAGHAMAGIGLVTDIVILIAASLFIAVLTLISTAVIRQRRAAAGACQTCTHPCRPSPQTPQVPLALADAPRWPHRPLTRAPLPVIIVPRQSPPAEHELTRATAVGALDR